MNLIDSNKIKGRMRELGLTQAALAADLGMNPSTFNKKVNARSGASFTVIEADLLGDKLAWSRADKGDVFFNEKLA